MANFNAQAFMDSLTNEMQEMVRACRTEDELAALIPSMSSELT